MAFAPKPVSLTTGPNPTPGHDPEALIVVGGMPAPTASNLTAVPASFADLAAVRTYLNTLVTELKASPYFN